MIYDNNTQQQLPPPDMSALGQKANMCSAKGHCLLSANSGHWLAPYSITSSAKGKVSVGIDGEAKRFGSLEIDDELNLFGA